MIVLIEYVVGIALLVKIIIVFLLKVASVNLRVILVEFKVDLLPDVNPIIFFHLIILPLAGCINRCIWLKRWDLPLLLLIKASLEILTIELLTLPLGRLQAIKAAKQRTHLGLIILERVISHFLHKVRRAYGFDRRAIKRLNRMKILLVGDARKFQLFVIFVNLFLSLSMLKFDGLHAISSLNTLTDVCTAKQVVAFVKLLSPISVVWANLL